jgi:hypothetical protein
MGSLAETAESSRREHSLHQHLEEFEKTPGSNKMIYAVDGHLAGDGQALVSRPLIEQLTQGNHPILPGCNRPHTSEGQ